MAALKGCPFCGCEIEITENVVRESFAYIVCECPCCHMEFAHQQDFAISRLERVPLTDDFTTVWNRRTNNGN